MDCIRPLVKRLRRILKRDETPSWIYKEIEKRQSQAALKQFLARRTVDSRTKKETLLPKINNLNVKAAEFISRLDGFQVKICIVNSNGSAKNYTIVYIELPNRIKVKNLS